MLLETYIQKNALSMSIFNFFEHALFKLNYKVE